MLVDGQHEGMMSGMGACSWYLGGWVATLGTQEGGRLH